MKKQYLLGTNYQRKLRGGGLKTGWCALLNGRRNSVCALAKRSCDVVSKSFVLGTPFYGERYAPNEHSN